MSQKYATENLNKISFPLGGIGSGCIGLSGHGELVDFEIFNRPNKYSLNGYSHFAVRAMREGEVVDARVLVSDRDISASGRNDMKEQTLQGFPHFKENTFETDGGRITLRVLDGELILNELRLPFVKKILSSNAKNAVIDGNTLLFDGITHIDELIVSAEI